MKVRKSISGVFLLLMLLAGCGESLWESPPNTITIIELENGVEKQTKTINDPKVILIIHHEISNVRKDIHKFVPDFIIKFQSVNNNSEKILVLKDKLRYNGRAYTAKKDISSILRNIIDNM